nr:uncharacterized protein LOC110151555 [Odocoileus virginianus texanus]
MLQNDCFSSCPEVPHTKAVPDPSPLPPAPVADLCLVLRGHHTPPPTLQTPASLSFCFSIVLGSLPPQGLCTCAPRYSGALLLVLSGLCPLLLGSTSARSEWTVPPATVEHFCSFRVDCAPRYSEALLVPSGLCSPLLGSTSARSEWNAVLLGGLLQLLGEASPLFPWQTDKHSCQRPRPSLREAPHPGCVVSPRIYDLRGESLVCFSLGTGNSSTRGWNR